MSDILTSSMGFSILLTLFAIGAIGSLVVRKNDATANGWSTELSVMASVWGLLFSTAMILGGQTLSFVALSSPFALLSFSFRIDALTAFFIFVISLISLFSSIYGFGYVKHFYKKYDIGVLGFFYHLFIAGMVLVASASNGIFFLIVWEIMSVASYFLVVYDRDDDKNVKAGFLYLIMTHIGTVFILLAFLLLYTFTGSYDFETIKGASALIPAFVKNAVFVFALIGFGTKAGIVPFHIWLPSAHPAAPSHVSALMSGVMIKTGVFMMIRMFLDILQPAPMWWGLSVLIVGAVSAVLGVLYALTEHDIKKLLAYHSIENIGIILLGLGSTLTFASLGMHSLALFGLSATLFHIVNHAIFKSLLFLSAGSVINEMHTRNMEEYGGLINYMPQTALFFLIGSMAISALPPFNGFFSEWMTFQTLFQGIAQLHTSSQWIFVFATGALALTGGLALACFVKAFAAIFLARPRSAEVAHTKESSLSMRIGMGALTILALLFGLFSGYIAFVLEKVGKSLLLFHDTPSFVSVNADQTMSIGNGFASVSALVMFAFFVSVLGLTILIVRYAIHRQQKVVRGDTWDCGTTLSARMEITATGFAQSIIVIFKNILKPSIQHSVEYHDAESRYLPKSRTVTLGVGKVYHSYLYRPLLALINKTATRISNIQSGNINAYISYIFLALALSLFLAL